MKRKIVVAAVTAAVLIGGGTATAVAFADGHGRDSHDDSRRATNGVGLDDSSRSATAHVGHDDSGRSATARVGLDDAVAAAVKAVPGTVTEAERDDEDGKPVWELDVYGSDRTWHDVTVDARSAKVLGTHASDDNDDRSRHAPRSAPVPLGAAVDAALRAVPGTVTSIELDDTVGRSGALRWEVDITGRDGNRHELNVDAKTAAVTADRPDDGRHGDDD
ncbi:PepSY domain-containing protein [Streptomyces sp. NPDC057486]|uniref:PepSY domain-containing protein n=1 Tax=Streptomyces sp. NPDC057486 TaxID=3346145 RepID=UPI0036B106EC